MSDGVAILLVFVLLATNAFFVGAEFALISSRRDRLETLIEQGVHRARIVVGASRQTSLMLAGAQLGVTICSLLLGRLGEPAVVHLLELVLHPVGVPAVVLHAVAFAIAVALVTVAHVLIGEMVPKNLAIASPERLALWLVPPLAGFVRLTRPFITLLNLIANGTLRLMRVEPRDELAASYTPEEMAELISESRREGLLHDAEHRRLAQTLSSTERSVADVVVPVEELTTLPERPTLGDVQDAVAHTGFSRYPLRGRDGRLVGYLHVKDVLDQAGADPATPVPQGRVRGLPELPADARLDDALAALRRARSHLAKAVAPDGRVLGVVALEDLLEEYVGRVRDSTHIH